MACLFGPTVIRPKEIDAPNKLAPTSFRRAQRSHVDVMSMCAPAFVGTAARSHRRLYESTCEIHTTVDGTVRIFILNGLSR